MTVIEAFRRGLRLWTVFSGRAGRAEFWGFALCVSAVAALMILCDLALFGDGYRFGLADLWALAMLVPLLSALVRRLHDIGRGGWWALLLLLPIAGALLLILWASKPGEAGANRFGQDPLGGID